MKLISSNGDECIIFPLRYEFRKAILAEDDLNWVVIRGEVRLADGRTWSFIDPCMDTRDLLEVDRWLRGIVAGHVYPHDWDHHDSGDPTTHVLDFLEPNLAFRLAERRHQRCVIEVAFDHEAHPERSHRADPFYVRLDVSFVDVKRAADEWDRERQAFPPR